MITLGHTALTKSAVALLAAAIALTSGITAATAASTVPTVTTGTATAVKPTSITVNATVNPHGTATTWYFQYGLSTDASYGSKTVVRSAGAGTADVSVSSSLTGLAPATSYHYRIIATSSAGTTNGGDGVFNTTAAPVVVTGAASQLTASSATLNGIINPEGLATSWYFQYGTTTAYGSVTPTVKSAASPNNTNVSATISSLASRTAYHFRLVATSSAGKSSGVDFVLTTGLTVTLNASASTVIYGGAVKLSGTVSSGTAGDTVTVSDERFNQSAFTGVTTITTGAGGAWSYSTQPTARTSFEATADGGTSSPVVIDVRPTVSLSLSSKGRLSTRVTAGVSFASHVLQLQRLTNGLWVTWKHVRLNANAKATFVTSLPKGRTAVRMAIGPFVVGIDQAAPGYLAGFSSAINYHRS